MSSYPTQPLLDDIKESQHVQLSVSKLAKGIDNYHIDIKLSNKFSSDIKKLVALLISQMAVPKPKAWDNSRLFEKVRDGYLDLMTLLIHRVKTDLSADELCLMQFAPIKLILSVTRLQIDQEIESISSKLADLRQKGATEALATDQHLFWLKKNYDSILYNVNKQIFSQLQRVEERQLNVVRDQYLGENYAFVPHTLINSLLYTSKLSALPLLLNEFSLWNWNGENSSFITLNSKLESLLNKRIKDYQLVPLRDDSEDASSTEIHDELSGLFKSQDFLGQAADSKSSLEETFCWFELPQNLERLFSIKKNRSTLAEKRKDLDFRTWRQRRGEINQFEKILKAFIRILKSQKLLPQLLATHYMKRALNSFIVESVDLKVVCQFLSGQINARKLQAGISGGNKLSSEQMKSLEKLKSRIKKQVSKADSTDSLKLLMDVSRYRQQLKYYRLAHRAFNRISIRTADDEIKLSQSAGTLYSLPTSSEIEENTEKICHHAIMKADVRGSTTVTDELQNKGLNPASYFSMRFFNPINKILETYAANKVFIEGDAIILSFLEYENTPQQWFSVSRSCGYARDMLKIVGSNNRYSTQMGLPLLELGVGICYSNEAPRYLYDEDKPIMISGAIGLADRMSSCSWNLRQSMEKGLFNVAVLRIADGENEKGEKGQHYVRYNVNGILVDEAGFQKLREEMALKSLRMKLNGKEYLFHVGQYPDANGRKKDLVIREGKVGIWQDSKVLEDPDGDESYFEIVVNRKVLPLVLEAFAGKQATTA